MEAMDDGLGRHRDELRPAAVAQLLGLCRAGKLTTAHVQLVSEALNVHIRTVWDWLASAEKTGSPEKPERSLRPYRWPVPRRLRRRPHLAGPHPVTPTIRR
ncbi:hypothetical protein GCM10023237_69530 [Streptomyces coeruleoprunus]